MRIFELRLEARKLGLAVADEFDGEPEELHAELRVAVEAARAARGAIRRQNCAADGIPFTECLENSTNTGIPQIRENSLDAAADEIFSLKLKIQGLQGALDFYRKEQL